MSKCPLTRQDCTVDCAWWRNDAECYIASLPDLINELDDVAEKIEALRQTIYKKDFTE